MQTQLLNLQVQLQLAQLESALAQMALAQQMQALAPGIAPGQEQGQASGAGQEQQANPFAALAQMLQGGAAGGAMAQNSAPLGIGG